MSEVRFSAVIPFPVERVWALMIQPERMAEWNTEIPEVRDITGPMDRVGGGYRQVWQFAGRRMVSKGLWQVTSVEPFRHREFRGLTPMGPMVGRDWFEPIEEGTRLTIQVEYTPPWGPLGRLLDPILRAMFRRTIARNGRALTGLLADEDRNVDSGTSVNEEGSMHARVSVFQMAPEEVDAGVEYGRGTIQQMMEMEGFLGNLALVDREAGRITSITLWESEEAMRTSEERANTMRSSGAAAVDASVVSVDRYEVGYFIQP